jgi:predicted permease
MLNDLLYRIRTLFRSKAVEAELNDELRFHFERQVEKLMGAGVGRDEAMRQARLSLGGLEQVKEECRQARGVALIEALAQDIGYALRILRKSPGFTAAVTLSLALGIGANTAVFSLIDAVMWRMLPVKNPEGLLLLVHGQGASLESGFTFQQFRLMREQNKVLTKLAAYSPARLNVSVNGSIEPAAEGQLVSGSYFSVLGVRPIAGRAISPEDDLVPNGHPVAMISYGYWKRRFGLAPSAVGRTITLSGMSFTIIGVTPPEFFGVEVGAAPDIFVPVMMQPTVMPAFENLLANPVIYRTWLHSLGRLKPGIHAPRAAAELEILFRQELPKGFKAKGEGFDNERLALTPAAMGLSDLRRRFSQPLFILMAVVGIVLLIACANTANLLLARAASRRAEFAMRLALGASRWRLTSQLLVESIVLAILGGVCGILLARWATQILVTFLSAGRAPVVLNLTPDLRVLGFTAAVSIATGILFGIAPAMRATRIDLAPALKSLASLLTGGRGGLRPGKILAVAQVALSLLLLIGAGLFVRSLQKLNSHDAGFARESVLIARVEPRGSDQRNIPGASAGLDRIYRELLQNVESIPGVRSASLAQFTPTRINGLSAQLNLPSGEVKRVFTPMVYPSYFATLGIRMSAGRDFNSGDLGANSAPVSVVNESFVRQVFQGESAVGKQIRMFGGLREIIGVVKDSRYSSPRGETPAIAYQPFLQTRTGRGQMALYVRVAGASGVILPRIREALQNIDRDLPMFEVRTLAEEMDAALIQERLIATLSSFFGVLALLLASIGLYGLLAFAVVQRTGEMGIRMALGARRSNVVWMVMREALLLVVAGIAIGVPAVLAGARLASSQVSGLLFGLEATDPLTIAFATLLLASVAMIAGYLPARRASRVDPMMALRNE